ncbi:amidohydrolase family protein [Mycobacteroides abscessus]|uniref:amidohydrolase family protein n=1 Tax=Mycobacteroides abscessus TaxID=36809 RepID=UPI0009CB4270|nr:amidohydrolase family protein [Mycobacteroides abscessus]SLF24448.1 imidazolonepropionase [Mycobacteroides abscessus subsp. abscessus]
MASTALINATVIVGDGTTVDNASVVLDGDKIIAVTGSDLDIASDVERIDCTGKWIMPGLIDVHTHTVMWGGETDWGNILDTPDEYLMVRSAAYLPWWLEGGFTTVLDALARRDMPFEMRRALRDGIVAGPRLLVAGPAIVATGARGSFFGPREVSGADEALKAAREQTSIYRSADVVKIMCTSEVLTGHLESRVQLLESEIAATVDEAHRSGVPVHCHAYGGPGVQRAVEQGVDVIVHGQPIGWEPGPRDTPGVWQSLRKIDGGKYANTDYSNNYALMAERGTIWAPTLSYYDLIRNHHWEDFTRHVSPLICSRVDTIAGLLEENFRLALDAGVRVACGTDAGMPFTYHGDSAYELELYVRYGMTPMQAITSATKTAAEALWIEDRVGTVEAGKTADLLVLSDNPLTDIRVLQRKGEVIERVFRDGEQVATNGTVHPPTRQAVLTQLRQLETLEEVLGHRSPYATGALGRLPCC